MSADQNLSAGQFYHGTTHHIPAGDSIRTRALPLEYGWLQHNYFTTDRKVAEGFAEPRGKVYVVRPAGDYEVDPGEPSSYKSKHPLRIVREAEAGE